MKRCSSLLLVTALAGGVAVAAPDEPVPGPDRVYAPPQARRSKLANGLALLIIERRTLPLVRVELIVSGAGAAADPPGKPGLAAFTADLVDEGSAGRDALAMARAVDTLGATLTTRADRRAAYVAMSTLSRTLEPSLDLFAQVVTAPAFVDAEVKRVHSDRLTALKLRRDQPRDVAALRLDAALFGAASPNGHPVEGEAASFARLRGADARAFHRAAWDPAASTLVVAGDIDAAAVEQQLAARLGGWKRGASTRPAAMPPGRASPARLVLVDRPGAAQSDVVLGVASIPRSDERVYAWEVLVNAFGGGFTGRLTQRLREQLGYLYHVYPELTYDAAGGDRYTVLAPLVSPHTADGIKEILAMADDLAKNGSPPAELEKARKNLVRDLPGRFDTNADMASAFGELALLGLPDDWYASYGKRILAVDAAAVRSAAQALLEPGKIVFAVVGDLARVRAGLEALGLGKAEVYDLEGKRR